jgi:hypothetical protein
MNNLYKIIEDVNLPYIELLDESAEFSGICFRYGQVKFNESEQVLTFDWDIVKYNDIPKQELNKEKLADIIDKVIFDLILLKEQELVGVN